MSKKKKQQLKEEGWMRVYQKVLKDGDLNKFSNSYMVAERVYGQCSGLLWYRLRHELMHNHIILLWLSNTNVVFRNELYLTVKRILGKGLADELQRISSSRTWN